MLKVRIKKLCPTEKPDYPTPHWDSYIPGEDNGNVSIPMDYEVEGYLMSPIVVGKPVQLARTKRNGLPIDGVFQTSKVTAQTEIGFTTKNSVYEVEVIQEETKGKAA